MFSLRLRLIDTSSTSAVSATPTWASKPRKGPRSLMLYPARLLITLG